MPRKKKVKIEGPTLAESCPPRPWCKNCRYCGVAFWSQPKAMAASALRLMCLHPKAGHDRPAGDMRANGACGIAGTLHQNYEMYIIKGEPV